MTGKRLFTKVSPALWTSRRYRGVEHLARLYFTYLLTNAHIDSTGCYRLPDAYACSDFGIDAETQTGLVASLVKADLIAVDSAAEYVLIKRWFKHNPLTNADHAKGTKRLIAEIESDSLREDCEAAFAEAEIALNARLEQIDAAKADREQRAKLRAANAQSIHPGSDYSNGRLTNSKYMNPGAK